MGRRGLFRGWRRQWTLALTAAGVTVHGGMRQPEYYATQQPTVPVQPSQPPAQAGGNGSRRTSGSVHGWSSVMVTGVISAGGLFFTLCTTCSTCNVTVGYITCLRISCRTSRSVRTSTPMSSLASSFDLTHQYRTRYQTNRNGPTVTNSISVSEPNIPSSARSLDS
jgi:hypothetical protein